MTQYEINNFEKSVHKTEELYEFLKKELPNEKLEIHYTLSYANQFHYSKLGQASIKLKRNYNNEILIHAYMCGEKEKPFIFSLWKYDGNHKFQDEDKTEKEINDFWTLLKKIKSWYGINQPRYEQLTLF